MLTKEIQTGTFIVKDSVAQSLALSAMNNLNGQQHERKADTQGEDKGFGMSLFEQPKEKNVAVINIDGVMQKYSSYDWWDDVYVRGIDRVAEKLQEKMDDDSICGIVIKFNTPGGNTQALNQICDVLKHKTKPVIALIDGMCCSCGIYVASYCDRILAMNEMCEVGSIGVYVSLTDTRKYYEEMGVKIIEVYPPESSYKNKPYRDALDGNTQTLIDEVLSPFAQHFQNVVRANRPRLDESVEGILGGRTFYCKDAVNNGLIDEIGNLDRCIVIIDEINSLSNSINSLYQ